MIGNRKNRFATLANAKGIEKNLVAKKYIAKINYAPDVIKLSFLLKDNSALALDGKNYAPDQSIENYATAPKTENPPLVRETDVRSYSQTCLTDGSANFEILLPNIIHQSKALSIVEFCRRATA